MSQTFETFHPATLMLYFASVIVCAMTGMQPVVVAMSAVGGLLVSTTLTGVGRTCKQLIWQVPLLLIITIINPVISASGQTVIARFFNQPIYLESAFYGLCSGGLLIATIIWFSNAAAVLNSSTTLALFGNALPNISVMLAMTQSKVPQFVRRGHEIRDVARANTCSSLAKVRPALSTHDVADSSNVCSNSMGGQPVLSTHRNPRTKIARAANRTTTLMAWGMEDSLQTAASMSARGWGAWIQKKKNTTQMRTTYQRMKFARRDAVHIIVLCALIVLSAVSVFYATSAFRFYPNVAGWKPAYIYAPYGLLLLLPVAIIFKETIAWKLAQR